MGFNGAEQLLAIDGAAFLVAMIPGLLLARNITWGLKKLSAGIHRFRSGEYDVQVQVTSGDEPQHLGKDFNEMIISLGEKLALLPYVSRFSYPSRLYRHWSYREMADPDELTLLRNALPGNTSHLRTD